MNNRIIISLLFIVLVISAKTQNLNVTNERTFSALFNYQVDTASNFHTAIRPFSKNEISNYDGIMKDLDIQTESKFVAVLTNYRLTDENKSFISLEPIINTGFTLEKNETASQNLNELSFGLKLSTKVGKKWSGQLAFLADNSKYPSHIDAMVKSRNISPGYGYSSNDKSFFGQGNITFTADKNFTFQLGYGKNFIGDGYRSLFLSDYANSYPYLKITANIWRLKYMALYTNYQDIRNSDGNINNYFHKFSSVHYLSYNATKWLNFGLFESIIWQAQEDNFYRGYDINYLNPIIFLRPIEYSQGSADNALIGGSFKAKIKKKNIFYGQLIFDEFLLAELKSGNGWWGNKYGTQLGFKSYDFMWIKNLQFQLEYNMVMPFTYSYYYSPTGVSTLQNYAHFNSPLAHPLGSNFKEITIGLTYHKKRWIIEGLSTIAKVGLDTSATSSIGQDVYKPNNWRVKDYGHTLGQGLSTDIINSTLKISYVINPKSQLLFQFGITNRMYKNDFADSSTNMFFIGLKTAIINRYTDI